MKAGKIIKHYLWNQPHHFNINFVMIVYVEISMWETKFKLICEPHYEHKALRVGILPSKLLLSYVITKTKIWANNHQSLIFPLRGVKWRKYPRCSESVEGGRCGYERDVQDRLVQLFWISFFYHTRESIHGKIRGKSRYVCSTPV